MISFCLMTLHLGDVLMALPAMRDGDEVAARPQHRVPGAPVKWTESPGGLHAIGKPGVQRTEAWLEAVERVPVRHELMPNEDKTLLVIAPDVADPGKKWHGWGELGRKLPGASWVGSGVGREAWMGMLNRAHTVICPDTGTAHMADALGCPRVVALHGQPDNWPRCAPFWDRSGCIVRGSMGSISVDDVVEAARA